jgi:hypothetical protein
LRGRVQRPQLRNELSGVLSGIYCQRFRDDVKGFAEF